MIAFVFSHPGSPALDEAKLKMHRIFCPPNVNLNSEDGGLDNSRGYGARVSVVSGNVNFKLDGRQDIGPDDGNEPVRVTVLVPLKMPIADRQLIIFFPGELRTEVSPTANDPEGPPMGPPGGVPMEPRPPITSPDRITGTIAEFERTGACLQLIRFLTPVCEAKRSMSP